jgi:hypothetical protein
MFLRKTEHAYEVILAFPENQYLLLAVTDEAPKTRLSAFGLSVSSPSAEPHHMEGNKAYLLANVWAFNLFSSS